MNKDLEFITYKHEKNTVPNSMTRLERRLLTKAKNRCLRKGHKPTGIWSFHDNKSWAECKVCGEYETIAFEGNMIPNE